MKVFALTLAQEVSLGARCTRRLNASQDLIITWGNGYFLVKDLVAKKEVMVFSSNVVCAEVDSQVKG